MIRKNSDIKENKSGNEILWLVLSQLYLKDAHIFYVNVYLQIYTQTHKAKLGGYTQIQRISGWQDCNDAPAFLLIDVF